MELKSRLEMTGMVESTLDGKPVEGEWVFILWGCPSVDLRHYIYGGQTQPFLHVQLQVGSWCGEAGTFQVQPITEPEESTVISGAPPIGEIPFCSLLHFGGYRHHSLRGNYKVGKPAPGPTETRTPPCKQSGIQRQFPYRSLNTDVTLSP
jgi:hypothetical protein